MTDSFVAYQASRDPGTDRSVLCHAPFAALNFEQQGQMRACCYNWQAVLGVYPTHSPMEAWQGAQAQHLRAAFVAHQEPTGCELCFHQLRSGNFSGALMRNYDALGQGSDRSRESLPEWPREMTFEISNTCNLECVMCDGKWSSAIRAHREKRPPLRSPYDAEFVRQLEPFLTRLSTAKFLGGEPFLIDLYYEIWQRLIQVNPGVQVSITTNGTVMTPRVQRLLGELRSHVVVSLDALQKDTFETIRKGASHERVMANVQYLLGRCRAGEMTMSLAVCPLVHNWKELPALLSYANERGLALYFNTVVRPAEASIGGLPLDELEGVLGHLRAFDPPRGEEPRDSNRRRWDGLVSQVEAWRDDKARLRVEAESARIAFSPPAREWNEMSARPLPASRLTPLLEALAHGRAIEKVFLEQGVDLGQEVPRILHGARIEATDDADSVEALLRVILLFGGFADRLAPASTPARLGDDQARLSTFVRFLYEQLEDGAEYVRVLGSWLRYVVESGRFREVWLWLAGLLADLPPNHDPRHWGRTAVPLNDDDPPDARLLRCARSYLSTPCHWAQLAFEPSRLKRVGEAQAAADTPLAAAAKDGTALLAQMPPRLVEDPAGVARLFREIRERLPGDLAAERVARLERRMASITETLALGTDWASAFSALSSARPADITAFLLDAPDAEFERRLRGYR